MVPYHSLHRIHGWIKCENTWKKKNQKKIFFKQINARPRKGKVSIHSHENQCKWHTGCYEKCVNLTNNHPRRYPPKNQCQLRNTFSHVVRIPQVNSKLWLSAEFPWHWRHTCSNFLLRERESRAFLNKIPINRLTLRASSTYTSCLRLHHNIFPSPLPDNQTLFSH